jgi:hypothetical protein
MRSQAALPDLKQSAVPAARCRLRTMAVISTCPVAWSLASSRRGERSDRLVKPQGFRCSGKGDRSIIVGSFKFDQGCSRMRGSGTTTRLAFTSFVNRLIDGLIIIKT